MILHYIVLFGPLLLAGVALALALVYAPRMQAAASGISHEIDGLTARTGILRQGIANLPPIPERAEPEPEPPPTVSTPPAELTPLERARAKGFEWLNGFDAALHTCSAATGLDGASLTTDAWQPDAIADRLNRALTEQDLRETHRDVTRTAVEIVQVLVSKCDHDLDPEFSDTQQRNERLQQAIEWLVQAAGLKLYTPKIGEAVDKRRQISVGVGARAGDELRGTVASVRARGILDARDNVITPAEIREYD